MFEVVVDSSRQESSAELSHSLKVSGRTARQPPTSSSTPNLAVSSLHSLIVHTRPFIDSALSPFKTTR